MTPEPETNPPEDEPAWTLYRFCRWLRLPLDHNQRSVVGIELSRICRERQLPLRKVREKLEDGIWCRSKVYPEAVLREWLVTYRKKNPRPSRKKPAPTPQVADNG